MVPYETFLVLNKKFGTFIRNNVIKFLVLEKFFFLLNNINNKFIYLKITFKSYYFIIIAYNLFKILMFNFIN